MDNASFKKIQNDIKKSKAIIIKNDDSVNQIKKNFGNNYDDDISDSDDDNTTYQRRNRNIINKLPDKNNTDNISITSRQDKKKPNKNVNIIDDTKPITTIKKEKEKDKVKGKEKVESDPEPELELEDENEDENEDGDVDSDMEYEFQEEFEDKVKAYVKVDDDIRELQKQIKVLNCEKKVIEEAILKHLERLGENNINITGGKLRINKYESKEGFKEPIVKEVIANKFKDPKVLETIMEDIEEKRIANAKVQISLKRTYERGKVKGDKK
jgi:hypothetical protein